MYCPLAHCIDFALCAVLIISQNLRLPSIKTIQIDIKNSSLLLPQSQLLSIVSSQDYRISHFFAAIKHGCHTELRKNDFNNGCEESICSSWRNILRIGPCFERNRIVGRVAQVVEICTEHWTQKLTDSIIRIWSGIAILISSRPNRSVKFPHVRPSFLAPTIL